MNAYPFVLSKNKSKFASKKKSMEYHIITILAIVVIYNLWCYNHEDKQPDYCTSISNDENSEIMIENR